MKVFYRISDNSYYKMKLPGTDKKFCLYNFLSVFEKADITVIADNVLPETLDMIHEVFDGREFQLIETKLSNAGSFNFALQKALELNDDEIVYFVEDDYLHFSGSTPFGDKNAEQILIEGIEKADYVTLYDHPDKYHVEYGYQELCHTFKSKSSMWRTTVSTCMTFAATVKKLKEDLEIWQKHTVGSHPHDNLIFQDLKKKGRRLAVSIPGLAFHTDLTYPLQHDLVGEMVDQWAVTLVEEYLIRQIALRKGIVVEFKQPFMGKIGNEKLMLLCVLLQS